MKNLLIAIVLMVGIASCGSDQCNECTGVNADGVTSDFTVCDNEDGTTTRTNNTTNVSTTDSLDYLASVVFLESLGLECK